MKHNNILYILAALVIALIYIQFHLSENKIALSEAKKQTLKLEKLILELQTLKKVYKPSKEKKKILDQLLDNRLMQLNIKTKQITQKTAVLEFENLNANATKFFLQKLIKHKIWIKSLNIKRSKGEFINARMELVL